LYALPMLLPLSLLAAGSLTFMKQGTVNAMYWSGIIVFTVLAGVIWLLWVSLEFAMPQHLNQYLLEIQPGFNTTFNFWVFIIALGYTFGWMALLARLKRNPQHVVMLWAAGMTMVWGLLMTQFVSWLDMGKSYRSMIADLRHALPNQQVCIASRTLGEPQRAMLQYFAGIITQREESSQGQKCNFLLVQSKARDTVPLVSNGQKIWEGTRPGDNTERYRLYRL
jgi:hypothetical protein